MLILGKYLNEKLSLLFAFLKFPRNRFRTAVIETKELKNDTQQKGFFGPIVFR
jgi:hypothetical protein